jgi:hypothetical protein
LDHILEIIKTDVEGRLTRWLQAPNLRSTITGSRTLTTIFPNTCTVTFSFENNRDKSKRIAVVVHMVRAENEEFDLEQQESSATALTSPQYTKNVLTRKIAKKTQVETIDKIILAANTEDLKIENPNKFKNQVTKTGANHQPL